MPNYDWACVDGHVLPDKYVHVLGVDTVMCEECGHTMHPAASFGRGLTFFEEGRGRWIHNMGVEPVYVTSHEQHKSLMRERKLEWATERKVKGTGGWI